MGIPCPHMLMKLLQDDGVVTPIMFHKHWHLATAAELKSAVHTVSAVPGTSTALLSLLHNSDDSTNETEYICNPPIATLKGWPRFIHVHRVYDNDRQAPGIPMSQSSIQQDARAFEWVEGLPEWRKRCRVCKRTGHNSRTCPRPAEIWAAILEVDETL